LTFLEQFFGEGNALRLDESGPPGSAAKLRALLQPFLALYEREGPLAILPRVQSGPQRTDWYFLCRSSADRRWARDLLRASVGASFLTERNRERALDRNDSIDAAVLNVYGEASFAVPVAATLREMISPRLERLSRLLVRQPERFRAVVRPTGRILRDFELALQARDGSAANECIAALHEGQRLGVQNLEFLKIRRDVAMGNYDQALSSPRFDTYREIGFPRRVVSALLEAVWAKEVAPWTANSPPANVLARFTGEVLPRYGALLRTRAGLKGPGIAPLFLLDEVASASSDRTLVDGLVQELAGGEWAAFASGIAGLIPTTTIAAPQLASSAAAGEAFIRGELDAAYRLALESPPSFERTLLLLRCAREMDTFASASKAFEALEGLPTEQRALFTQQKSLTRLLSEFEAALLGPTEGVGDRTREPLENVKQLPQDWIAWLARLTEPGEWIGAVKAAEKGQREWSLATSLSDSTLVERMTNLIEQTRPSWGEVALRDAGPFLISAIDEVEAKAPLRPIVSALYLHMATDETSRAVWLAMARLFELELDLGVDRVTYHDHLECLTSGLSRMRVPAVVDPALYLLETLAHHPRQDSEALSKYLEETHSLFLTVADKADRTAKCVFTGLARILGVDLQLPEQSGSDAATADVWKALSGKEVALYSLSKFRLDRTREVLSVLCPTVRIKCFEEHVATPAMVAAARNADLFVIDTRNAKHPATWAIEASRSSGSMTVHVHGLGNTALLRSIEAVL
jgi:hypothetical protein